MPQALPVEFGMPDPGNPIPDENVQSVLVAPELSTQATVMRVPEIRFRYCSTGFEVPLL